MTSYDLYLVEEVILLTNPACLVQSDIGFKIPLAFFDKTHPRSRIALKFTDVGGGVIDTNYRGPVVEIFFNVLNIFIQIKEYERFCTNSISKNCDSYS